MASFFPFHLLTWRERKKDRSRSWNQDPLIECQIPQHAPTFDSFTRGIFASHRLEVGNIYRYILETLTK